MDPEEILALRQRLGPAARAALDALVIEITTSGAGSTGSGAPRVPRPPSQWLPALRRIMPGLTGPQAAAILAYAGAAVAKNKMSAAAPRALPPSEEQLLMELQRHLENQAQLYAMLSAILHAQHDTAIRLIQNLR